MEISKEEAERWTIQKIVLNSGWSEGLKQITVYCVSFCSSWVQIYQKKNEMINNIIILSVCNGGLSVF